MCKQLLAHPFVGCSKIRGGDFRSSGRRVASSRVDETPGRIPLRRDDELEELLSVRTALPDDVVNGSRGGGME